MNRTMAELPDEKKKGDAFVLEVETILPTGKKGKVIVGREKVKAPERIEL
jgi:hypothetical protein